MEGYDDGSLYAPFLSLKPHQSLSKSELEEGKEEASKVREGSSRSRELKKKGKKQKFAFQTRSQVDILDDGYRWRKYGQKAVKTTSSLGVTIGAHMEDAM
ncbi:hypothetical protein Bca52824_056623 [Brassica carinata]|uniref:WRKY domain-containing protein n=1 Tax=Brassica carinata TaxID=52824 RepID=A0A8X7QUP9_BRACI|nr:hypothetical protein Bca52824_056623 [Brassica carinata]